MIDLYKIYFWYMVAVSRLLQCGLCVYVLCLWRLNNVILWWFVRRKYAWCFSSDNSTR